MPSRIERRIQHRIKIRGYTAYMNDGKSTYEAVVQDISLTGLRLSNMSNKFIMRTKPYNIMILDENKRRSCILAKYRWIKKRGHFTEIGFYVIRSSKEWIHLIRRYNKNTRIHITWE